VLFQGTADHVRLESENCLRSVDALSGGFILGSGCEVVPGTPVQNMRAMVDAAHGFGG
jgi:uroporphyrinogen decarboxylase